MYLIQSVKHKHCYYIWDNLTATEQCDCGAIEGENNETSKDKQELDSSTSTKTY